MGRLLRIHVWLGLVVLVGAPGVAADPAGAATFVVSSAVDTPDDDKDDGVCGDDQGRCTLRAAIEQADSDASRDTVAFATALLPPIRLTRALPVIAQPLTIDGSGLSIDPAPGVEIDGSAVTAPPAARGTRRAALAAARGSVGLGPPYGLHITAPGTVVRGVAIHGFAGAQVVFDGTRGGSLESSYLGLDDAGNRPPGPTGTIGVAVTGASGVHIGGSADALRNVISLSTYGAMVTAGASETVIEGNWFGTDGAGAGALAGPGAGVLVTRPVAAGGAPAALTTVGPGNAIAGGERGVAVVETNSTTVRGNVIGLTPAGRAAGPDLAGISVESAPNTTVGGPAGGDANVVSASAGDGIRVIGASSAGEVLGNRIGTDRAGAAITDAAGDSTANADVGIRVGRFGPDPAPSAVEVADNVLGANGYGVAVDESAGVVVMRNRIGTDAEAKRAFATAHAGILVQGLASGTAIDGNVVGNSGAAAIDVEEAAGDIAVTANRIGVGADGRRFPNRDGVQVFVPGTRVEGNVVTAATRYGIAVAGDAARTQVLANAVGYDPDQPATLGLGGNAQGGIVLGQQIENGRAPADVVVGAPGAGNTVVLSGGPGIVVSTASGARVQANRVGVTAGAATGVGNAGSGVYALDAPGVTIGGAGPGEGNVIAGNAEDGVRIARAGSTGARVLGNVIGAPGDGGNGRAGVAIAGASGATVGDLQARPGCQGGCNRIVNNGTAGILVTGDDAERNTLRGNAFADVHGLAVDLGELGRTAIDPGAAGIVPDGDKGPNGLLNTPVGVMPGATRTGDRYAWGAVSAPQPRQLEVDVYDVRPDGWGLLGTATPDEHGDWALRLPAGTVRVSALATDGDGNTSETAAVCSADREGDGICDDWEQAGGVDYDLDGATDFSLVPDDGSRRDLYLEADDHAGYRADPVALEHVQSAFARAPDHGVALHFVGDPVDETIPGAGLIYFTDALGTDDLPFLRYGHLDDPCDGAFGTPAARSGPACASRLGAEGLVTRYVVFAQSFRNDLKPSTQGYDATRRTLALGLGPWRGDRSQGGGKVCVTEAVCRMRMEEGVLMHELGHALGLGHGGGEAGDRFDLKPNYLSVMNDLFATPALLGRRPLDFSREALDTIDENALDESLGLGSAGAASRQRWGRSLSIASFPVKRGGPPVCHGQLIPASGPVDWDHASGAVTRYGVNDVDPAGADLQRCLPARAALDRLEGFDDWAAIELPVGLPDITPTKLDAAVLAGDLDGDGVSDADDVCPYAPDPGQADADGDGIGDACLALIDDRDVSVSVEGPDEDPEVGESVRLRVRAANDWPLAATGLRVAVRLPAGLRLTAASAGQGSFAGGVWELPELAKRTTAALTLDAEAVEAGSAAVEAEVVAAGEPDPDSTPADGDPRQDDLATATVRAIPAGGRLELSVADSWAREGASAHVTVAVRDPLSGDPRPASVDVRVRTLDGSATAGADYEPVDRVLHLDASDAVATLDVPLRADGAREPDETFTVELSGARNARVAGGAAAVTVVDADAPPTTGDIAYFGCVAGTGTGRSCGPVAHGLHDARALAVSPDGAFVYAASPADEAIAVLRRDERGQLQDAGCVRQAGSGFEECATESGGLGRFQAGPYALALTPDGRGLYAAGSTHDRSDLQEDPYAGGAIAAFARDPATGALTPAGCLSDPAGRGAGCAQTARPLGAPQAVGVSPDGRQVYVLTLRRGIARLDRDPATNELTPAGCVGVREDDGCAVLDPALEFGYGLAVAPDGRHVYVRVTDGVVILARAPDGALTPAGCLSTGDAACTVVPELAGQGALTLAPDGSRLYVADGDPLDHPLGTLLAFRRDRDTGALARVGCLRSFGFPAAGCAAGLAGSSPPGGTTPDGATLYAGAPLGAVQVLDAAPLAVRACVPSGLSAAGACGALREQGTPMRPVTASPAGDAVYALDGDAVAVFLTQAPGTAPVCADTAATLGPDSEATLTLGCVDRDGDRLTWTIVSGPAHGTLSAIDQAAGTVRYRPNPGYRGEDRFTFAASDGRRGSAPATFRLTVADPPPPPPPPSTPHLAPPPHVTVTVTTIGCPAPCTVNRDGTVPIVVTCTPSAQLEGQCSGTIVLDLVRGTTAAVAARRPVRLAFKRFRIRPGRPATVKVRLNRQGRRQLRRHARLRTRLTITLHARGAAPATRTRTLSLRARRGTSRRR